MGARNAVRKRDCQMNTEPAVRYLSKDPLLHVDMLESIRHGHAELRQVSDQGVLLYDKTSGVVMMSAENEAAAGRMTDAAAQGDMVVAHQNFYIPELQEKSPLQKRMTCHQAAYFPKNPLPDVRSSVKICPLDERYLDFIMEHYTHADDEEYLRERLRSGVMFGAFAKGICAGFIGMHGEGSIGMLEVLPEYRRRGVAQALESFQVNRLLARGNVPYAQIVVGNTASLELHRKLHFSISRATICWLM